MEGKISLDKRNIKISTIVTIHNAEVYLRECLDSICHQSFPHIEILCIDGGSTDLSPQILLEYQQKDNRIRIINDSNTSYGHKVNVGIEHAKGEYISVLESDDLYDLSMLEKLYQIADKYHPDFVNADYISFFDIDGKRHGIYTDMYEKEKYGRICENNKYPEQMGQILRYWTGIYNRDFLIKKNIRMNESPGASFQDMSFRFLTSILADTSYHMKEAVYWYRIDNFGSSVNDSKKAVVIADEYDFLKRSLIERGIDDLHIWKSFYQWKYRDFFGNLIRFSMNDRKALLERSLIERNIDKAEIVGEMFLDEITTMMLENSEENICQRIEDYYAKNKKDQDLLSILFSKIAENQIIIFGCGHMGKSLLKLLYAVKNQIVCYIDNNKLYWNTEWESIPILSPEEAIRNYPSAFYIIANKYHFQELIVQLKDYGIADNRIYALQ